MKFEFPLIIGIVAGAILTCLFCALVSRRLMGILQQEGYSGKALIKWLFRRGNVQRRRLSLLALSLLLLTALFNVSFSFVPAPWPNVIALAPYAGLYGLYLFSEKHYALKVAVKPTARLVRLSAVHTVLLAVLSAGLGFALAAISLAVDGHWMYLLRFVPFAAFPLLLPFTVYCAGGIAKIYEIPHTRGFVRRAEKTLQEHPCVKVGITGSFGKTSVKHLTAQLLSGHTRVQATPASYNTPVGIAKCVNDGLDCDVFLAEMGARKVGDIAELCDMVKPTVGIVTGVCAQHLETFKSLENIKAEKGVLAKRTDKVVLGRTAADMKKVGALVEGEDFAAEDVELFEDGTSFTLRIGGERAAVKTKLLGRHIAEDIALSAALCSVLGMTLQEIADMVPSLSPVPHRLERLEGNGAVILDDSYNSNVEGAKDAVEVLKLFEGSKFIVTPGLVELGALEEEANAALGASLVGLDRVILVGETLVLPVRRGYLEGGGAEEKLSVVPTLAAAQEILAKELKTGDAVLFLNDLPDKYI